MRAFLLDLWTHRGFRLWSPGPDGRDDGGKFGVELSSARQRSLNHESYLGDWVWRYDPAVKVP